LKDIDVTEP